MNKDCETCKFFKKHTNSTYKGSCTRFPKWIEVLIVHYCGEHSEVKKDG